MTGQFCDAHAADRLETAFTKSGLDWDQFSALMSYLEVDPSPVACRDCGAEGMTYTEPCFDNVRHDGRLIAARF